MAYSSLNFYVDYRAKLVKAYGPIGKSKATGSELPRLYPHDLLAICALLVPFLIRSLGKLSHASSYGHGSGWVLTRTKEDATGVRGYMPNVFEAIDPLATKLERGDMAAVFGRSLEDWIRKMRATPDPLVRTAALPGGQAIKYYFWPANDGAAASARSMMQRWDGLIAAVERLGKKGTAPGLPYYTLEETEYFFSAFYAACMQIPITLAIDTSFMAEVEDKAREAVKTGAEALKDAADEVGEIAADVADTAGEALGNFGSGFLRGIGLAGAALLIGLYVAKRKGLL